MTTETVLPQGWEIKRLGDICSLPQYGFTTKAAEKGTIKLLRTTDITSGEINWENVPFCYENPENIEKYLLKDGDILISRAGSVGVSYLISNPPKSVFASYLIRFKPLIEQKYLYFYLKSSDYWKQIAENSAGIAIPNVNANKLKNILIPVAPQEQQTAIVNKIESLFADIDAGIDSLKNSQMQLKQYRQSLLKNAFNGELTKQWREQNAEHLPSENELLAQIQTAREAHHEKQLADWQNAVKEWEQAGKIGKKPSKPKAQTQAVQFEENLDELPNGWGDFLLDNLAEISGGLTKNSKRNTFVEKAPYLRVANVYANELKLDEIETIGIQESEKARTLLQENDLLIVEGNGSIEQIGRVALWNGSINPCYHQNHLIKARCYPFALPKFVLYFLMSPIGRQGIINVASSTTGLHTLSLTKVANLIVPICSLAEQTQIVAILEQKLTACDTLATELANQLKQAELLKQAVLKSAFSGSLLDNTAQ